jgi:hypothetical protein
VAISIPLCFANRHEPVRNDVKWDGLNYTGTCKNCGKTIRRQKHKVWKLDDSEAADK